MRTKLYMIALAAMTMMLGSCSDSNSEFSQDYLADTPIKLNVSVDEPTTVRDILIPSCRKDLYSRSISLTQTNTIIWFGQKRLEITGKPINSIRRLIV